ncbi:hypothetical protein C8R43DRAFT_609779 [Mycena crocata]|nr:hypothetical protein C8R43DRAFT_609779 [Mycena crocata]
MRRSGIPSSLASFSEGVLVQWKNSCVHRHIPLGWLYYVSSCLHCCPSQPLTPSRLGNTALLMSLPMCCRCTLAVYALCGRRTNPTMHCRQPERMPSSSGYLHRRRFPPWSQKNVSGLGIASTGAEFYHAGGNIFHDRAIQHPFKFHDAIHPPVTLLAGITFAFGIFLPLPVACIRLICLIFSGHSVLRILLSVRSSSKTAGAACMSASEATSCEKLPRSQWVHIFLVSDESSIWY